MELREAFVTALPRVRTPLSPSSRRPSLSERCRQVSDAERRRDRDSGDAVALLLRRRHTANSGKEVGLDSHDQSTAKGSKPNKIATRGGGEVKGCASGDGMPDAGRGRMITSADDALLATGLSDPSKRLDRSLQHSSKAALHSIAGNDHSAPVKEANTTHGAHAERKEAKRKRKLQATHKQNLSTSMHDRHSPLKRKRACKE